MSKLLLVAVLALALPCAVLAGPFEDGQAAFRIGDYATAMRLWRPLAEQGRAAAQANIGFMYNFGRGVPQDYASAWVVLPGSKIRALPTRRSISASRATY
jgi:TPR repeat protein